ncbi:MAG TPA: hypothetical protein VMW35_19810 [Myxococcota bacterium]|jgi:hypothetical protein|nr:hypothetical protein [Myxococcota bacterium]
MASASLPLSFKGTLFFTWKGNRPYRVYVTDALYFIRRATSGVSRGTAAAIGSQFGLLGGLAVGLVEAAKRKSAADFVQDDDATSPTQLLAKHADNFALAPQDILEPRIEAKGKLVSFGPNSGRFHFTQRGDPKESVLLLESPEDASSAVYALTHLLGDRLRNDSGIVGAPPPEPRPAAAPASHNGSGPGPAEGITTDLPVPADQAAVVQAMQALTRLLGEHAPASWKKLLCEVRVAPTGSARALEIVLRDAAGSEERRLESDAAIYKAAMGLARKMSSSIRTFPGLFVEMTRLDSGGWNIVAKVADRT